MQTHSLTDTMDNCFGPKCCIVDRDYAPQNVYNFFSNFLPNYKKLPIYQTKITTAVCVRGGQPLAKWPPPGEAVATEFFQKY